MELSQSRLQPKEVGWDLTHSFAKEQMGVKNGDSKGSEPPDGSLESHKTLCL